MAPQVSHWVRVPPQKMNSTARDTHWQASPDGV